MGAAADACGACGVLQAAEPALDGGDPNAPRGSPTHRFVRALLREDPADVEHVDANPRGGRPAVVEVQEQRNIVQEVVGTGLKVVAVFGSAYALLQMAAPVINEFKRQVRLLLRPACSHFLDSARLYMRLAMQGLPHCECHPRLFGGPNIGFESTRTW